MPTGTRVHRCVNRLKKEHGLSAAIGICQKSTKQSYRTGRTLRKRKRRGGNPIKWYKTWRRRQEGQRKRRIVRRKRKRERMVKEVAAQLWAEEPEEDFDANATARRLLRLSHWDPEMAMHYWYEAYPDQGYNACRRPSRRCRSNLRPRRRRPEKKKEPRAASPVA